MWATISNIISSTVSSELTFRGGGRTRTLQILKSPLARRMRLSVDPRDGGVRLVLPKRGSMRAALRWAEAKRGWIEAQLDALPQKRSLNDGTMIEVAGEALTVTLVSGRGVKRDGDRLLVAGPEDMLAPRLIRWLKREELARLQAETDRFAALAGITVTNVAIGDPRSRWGSCSARGDIRYSWRLILAPYAVLEATVAHEVAHRLHMDHSAAFHAAVKRLLGRDPAPERAWLRANGASLHWLGRDP